MLLLQKKKKYNPATRTIMVEANDEFHATNLIHNQFGSFRWDKDLLRYVPSENMRLLTYKKVMVK